MRPLIAIVLGLVLVSTSGQIGGLHIHAYSDHAHPEHHHGPAAHEHQSSAPRQHSDGVRLEACDPTRHAVSLALGAAPPPQVQGMDAECARPDTIEPLAAIRLDSEVTDTRVHGPPPRTRSAPRAPPLSYPV